MRKNMQTVIAAFDSYTATKDRPVYGDSKRTCWTDGETIYSYAMPIARRQGPRCVVVVDRESAPVWSKTTSCQVTSCLVGLSSYSVKRGAVQ